MKIHFLGAGKRGDVCRAAVENSHHEITGVPEYADVGVLCNWPHILKAEDLRRPRLGYINCHGGPLPQYRGASVLNWQILNGATEIGLTIHWAVEAVDAGGIILEQSFPISLLDTIEDVERVTLRRFPIMLLEALGKIENGLATEDDTRAGGHVYSHRRPAHSELPMWDVYDGGGAHAHASRIGHMISVPSLINLLRASRPEYPVYVNVPGGRLVLSIKEERGV